MSVSRHAKEAKEMTEAETGNILAFCAQRFEQKLAEQIETAFALCSVTVYTLTVKILDTFIEA
jgi:hypothetical protein